MCDSEKRGQQGRVSRHEQKLQLVLRALHRLLHQVHIFAAVAERVLAARVDVYDPMHRRLF
jgi:hypothetical protein